MVHWIAKKVEYLCEKCHWRSDNFEKCKNHEYICDGDIGNEKKQKVDRAVMFIGPEPTLSFNPYFNEKSVRRAIINPKYVKPDSARCAPSVAQPNSYGTRFTNAVKRTEFSYQTVAESSLAKRAKLEDNASSKVRSTEVLARRSCAYCNIVCASNERLEQHIAIQHPNLLRNLLVCDICNLFRTSEAETLRKHKALHLEKSDYYFCHECRRYIHHNESQSHIARHEAEKSREDKLMTVRNSTIDMPKQSGPSDRAMRYKNRHQNAVNDEKPKPASIATHNAEMIKCSQPIDAN